MSEFVPTHESIGGVKVQVTKHPVPDVQAYDIKMPGTGTCGFVLNGCEFAALFAPIPKLTMVKITRDDADQLLICLQSMNVAGLSVTALQNAIAEAEAEAKT